MNKKKHCKLKIEVISVFFSKKYIFLNGQWDWEHLSNTCTNFEKVLVIFKFTELHSSFLRYFYLAGHNIETLKAIIMHNRFL